MYAYTADVQAIKDGEAIAPPSEVGFIFFKKTEGGSWSAYFISRDG